MDINKRYTLKELSDTYNPKFVQIVSGVHVVSIDYSCSGSWFLVKIFNKEKFYLKKWDESLEYMILSTTAPNDI